MMMVDAFILNWEMDLGWVDGQAIDPKVQGGDSGYTPVPDVSLLNIRARLLKIIG